MRFVTMRANASELTKRLRAELEQAWLLIDGKDRELAAVHDQARQLRELLASERQRILQLQNGNGHAVFSPRADAAAERQAQALQDHMRISQLNEALQVLGEQLDAAHYRILELTNQQMVVRGERPHLVSDNDAPLSNQAG